MSYELPAGSYFIYQAQGTIAPTNPSMAGIIAQVGQNLAPDYQVENSSTEGSGFLSSVSQAFSLNGIKFQATLTILSVTDSDTVSAKSDIDQAFQDVTGYPVTSSGITQINVGGTSQQQVAPAQTGTSQDPSTSKPCTGTSVLGICLNTSDTFLIFIVAIVVILVVALIISPATPARVAASFA